MSREQIKRALFSADLYGVLTDVQNGITSPGLASMANSAIRRIDAAREAFDTQPQAASSTQAVPRFNFTEGGFEDENERGQYVRYSDYAELARRLASSTTPVSTLPMGDAEREAWRDLVRRAWSLLDIECPNHPLVDELQSALAHSHRADAQGEREAGK